VAPNPRSACRYGTGCGCHVGGLRDRSTATSSRTLQAIRTALEAAGVEFIADNGGGAGCGCGITNGLLTFEASHILPLGLYPSSCRVWHDSHIRTRMAYGT
jgi:hypothetical protein